MTFSIIIPHKNIPELLQRCLDSIPVRNDVQVIVVDDNSDADKVNFDNFPQWKGEYYECYFTKKNKGAGYARNIGLQKAKGEWLTFIDADDFLVSNADEIFDLILQQNADAVFCDSIAVMSDDITKVSTRNIYSRYFNQYRFDHDDYLLRFRFHSLWGKFIRREITNKYNIHFHETKYSNDVYFSACIGCYAHEIHVLNCILYVVTERKDSLASSQFSNKIISVKECYDRTTEAINVRVLYDKYHVKWIDNQLFDYSKRFRKYHKIEYVIFVFIQCFKCPQYAVLLIKEDLKLIHKKFYNHA